MKLSQICCAVLKETHSSQTLFRLRESAVRESAGTATQLPFRENISQVSKANKS